MTVDRISRGISILREDGFSKFKRRSYQLLSEKIPPKYDHTLKNVLSEVRYGVPTNPLETYWIDPQPVTHGVTSFDRRIAIGTVKGGDWDEQKVSLATHPVHQGLRERFVDGKDWENTRYSLVVHCTDHATDRSEEIDEA